MIHGIITNPARKFADPKRGTRHLGNAHNKDEMNKDKNPKERPDSQVVSHAPMEKAKSQNQLKKQDEGPKTKRKKKNH